MNPKKIFINFSILAIIMFIVAFLWQLTFKNFFVAANYLSIVILWFLSLFFYFFTQKSLKSKAKTAFVNSFMAATIAKLFVLLVYTMIFIFTSDKNKVAFLIFLLFVYTVFSVYEIYIILKNLKNQKEEENQA